MDNLKKVCFFVEMNEEQKTGLFNATYQRINGLLNYIDAYEVYSIRYYDGKLYSLIKRLLKKNILSKGKDSFRYKNLTIKYLYVKNTISTQILKKLGLYFPLTTILKTKKYISEYELICAHWGFPQGGLAYILSKYLSIPYTVTYHGSDIHSLPFKYKSYLKNIVKVLNNADLNIFVSRDLMEFSVDKLTNKNRNNVVISNTVEPNNYLPLPKEAIEKLKKKYNLSNKVVGYVGNLLEVKGADRLPEIFKRIREQYKGSVDFLIIGDGDYFNLIKEKSREYNLNVLFLGKLEPEEISNFMNIIDVLVLPSRQESFGLVVLEANLCGTIVIGTKTGGIPEAIGNPELLVEDNGSLEEEMSKKVVEYLKKDYDKNKLRERVKNNYNPTIAYEKEYKTLNQLVKNQKFN